MTVKRIRKIDKTAVEVESGRIEEYISYINKNDIREVQINANYYLDENLSFLEKCPKISHVYIVDSIIKDYSELYSLKNLKYLTTELPKGELDLSLLMNLEVLHLTWNQNVKNLNKCYSLKELGLSKYKPTNKNLMELSNLEGLERLTLTHSSISSLLRIERLKKFTYLQLNFLKKIINFNGAEKLALTLQEIGLEKCVGVECYEEIG